MKILETTRAPPAVKICNSISFEREIVACGTARDLGLGFCVPVDEVCGDGDCQFAPEFFPGESWQSVPLPIRPYEDVKLVLRNRVFWWVKLSSPASLNRGWLDQRLEAHTLVHL